MAKAHVAQILEGEYGETFTLLLEQKDEAWIGWIEELPEVNCIEATKEDALEMLHVELEETLEEYEKEAAEMYREF
jgi:predicted RNase H-like HicB family nuclease